jgi:hypothetical protein
MVLIAQAMRLTDFEEFVRSVACINGSFHVAVYEPNDKRVSFRWSPR